MAFVALETGLKINRFSGLPGGTPEFRTRTSRVVTVLFQGALEDHLLCLMIHFNKTECQTSWLLQRYASQPGGPKGPADIIGVGRHGHVR